MYYNHVTIVATIIT